MRRALLLVFPAALAGAWIPAPYAAPKAKARLSVSTHHGSVPLAVKLTGTLRNVEGVLPEDCALRVEWTHVTPGGQRFDSTKETPCLEEGQGDPAAPITGFERQILLEEEGTYTYRIVLYPDSEERIAGNTQDIKAYKGRFELGVVRRGRL
ncbi:MAG TPA: hypothetical protein VJV23_14965 [Candidatus Polarisedimenticolia bacterium]|nr:hypothetical protein [Candidatus Polarisedimenticolia bacterium]